MKRRDLRIWLLLLLNVFVGPEALLTAPSGEQISKELMSKTFWLKTHEYAFGTPQDSKWSSRKIYTGEITIAHPDPRVEHSLVTEGSPKGNEVILINGKEDWKAKYFVSKKAFVVKHVNVSHNTCEIKLEAEDRKGGTTLNLKFDGRDDFDELFNAVFFREGDDTEAYESEVNELLVATYIDSRFDLRGMKAEEKKRLIRDLQSLCTRGYPEIEVHNEQAYACVKLPDKPMSNRYHADKDMRILTSAETAMKDAKSLIQAVHSKSTYLHGFVFYWQSSFILPFEEQDEIKENIRLMIPRSVFNGYEEGKLSVLETIEKSVLKVDGERYFIGPYDPENQSFYRDPTRITVLNSKQTQSLRVSDKLSVCLETETFEWNPIMLPQRVVESTWNIGQEVEP